MSQPKKHQPTGAEISEAGLYAIADAIDNNLISLEAGRLCDDIYVHADTPQGNVNAVLKCHLFVQVRSGTYACVFDSSFYKLTNFMELISSSHLRIGGVAVHLSTADASIGKVSPCLP